MPAAPSMAEEIIRSASNAFVRRVRRLKEKSGEEELCLIEGPRLLLEALAAGAEILEAALTPRFRRSDGGADLLARLRGTRVRLLEERLLSSLSELTTSQGVLALARRPSFEEEAIFRAEPLIVVAVGVQNPGNLGGLLRTAEAAGATGAYLTAGSADPLSWKALRGSMGSAFRLPHVRDRPVESLLGSLRTRKVRTIATVSGGGRPYDTVDLTGPIALLFGSEGSGLPPAVAEAADLRLSIPPQGRVESLNVGVAAGIALFEAARQRRR